MEFKGNSGKIIEIITQKVKKGLVPNNLQIKKEKRTLKNRVKEGKLSVMDWNYICEGLQGISKVLGDKIDAKIGQEKINQVDVSKIQKYAIGYKELIEDFMYKIQDRAWLQKRLHEEIDSLYDLVQITQSARDGIIMKKEERIDIFNGQKKKVVYDVPMTPEEVRTILSDYESQSNKIYANNLTNYVGIGLGVCGLIGLFLKKDEDNKKRDFIYVGVSGVGVVISEVINRLVLKEKLKSKQKKDKDNELGEKQWKIKADLYRNEPISNSETKLIIEEYTRISTEKMENLNQLGNINLTSKIVADIIQALIVGAYISKNVKITENGKMDGKSFATALIKMQVNNVAISEAKGIYTKIDLDHQKYKDFDKLCEQAQNIISQMEEKVYPLKGAEEPFDSFSIKNLDAKFYPKKNYETGKIVYSTYIKIPEFSAKRGDVILLSGASGAGKSTFLRMLKRGDINNREVIELDSGKKVDSLGKEFISFRPSMDLGNESSVLHQITGKRNIYELTKSEKMKLHKILNELHFDFPDLLEQMSNKED